MKRFLTLSNVIAVVSLAIAAIAMIRGQRAQSSPQQEEASLSANELDSLRQDLASLRQEIALMPPQNAPVAQPPHQDVAIDDRLAKVETSLAKLESAMNGVSLESASKEREELFKSDEGHLKADEYFAAEKWAIAGEGYLTFLEAHPEHPDAHDILERARNAFRKGNYTDKALWVQEEIVKHFPDQNEKDVMTLAQMQKAAGRYSDAVETVARAADLSSDPQSKLWRRMYWAWYNQLSDGNTAGLEAYRTVQNEIAKAGLSDGKIGERVREKIGEIERLTAGN